MVAFSVTDSDLPHSEGGQIVRHRFPSNRLHRQTVLCRRTLLAVTLICALAARPGPRLLSCWQKQAPPNHWSLTQSLAWEA